MARTITRRHALVGLSAAGLIQPARAAGAEDTVTWYISQMDAEQAEAMGRVFTGLYPAIRVEVVRVTGQVAFQRLQMDIKNKTPHCDVFSTSDISHMAILKDRGELTQYTATNASGLAPTYRALSDEGWYYVNDAARFVLIRNSSRVSAEAAPKRWTDLLDTKWKGQVALPHPAFSGGMGTWVLAITKQYGWSYFEKLAANNPRIGRSAVDPVTLLTAGECLVSPTFGPAAYHGIDKGNPIAVDQPEDGVVVVVFPSAIPARAPHPVAARLFMEWLLSDDYSRRIAAAGSDPIRTGVPPRPGIPPLESGKVIQMSVDEIRKGVPEIIEKWRETFGS
jgi:iron(III) transport system substrate-binding protein